MTDTMNPVNQAQTKSESLASDDFIMSPMVDVCFVNLMRNPIVRKGFCAAVLRIPPDMINETEFLPRYLEQEYADDKLGILDVRVRLADGSQINAEMQVRYFDFWDERVLFYLSKMFCEQLKKGDSYKKLRKCIHVSILDFIRFPEDKKCYRTIRFYDEESKELYNDKLELQILELKKLPEEIKTGEDIVNWMRFFKGKTREEFEDMAKTSKYFEEAFNTLQKLSADEQKRLEYELREKAVRDHIAYMDSARQEGIAIGEKLGEKRGEKRGEKKGIQLAKKAFKLHAQGISDEEIAVQCNTSVTKIREILDIDN